MWLVTSVSTYGLYTTALSSSSRVCWCTVVQYTTREEGGRRLHPPPPPPLSPFLFTVSTTSSSSKLPPPPAHVQDERQQRGDCARWVFTRFPDFFQILRLQLYFFAFFHNSFDCVSNIVCILACRSLASSCIMKDLSRELDLRCAGPVFSVEFFSKIIGTKTHRKGKFPSTFPAPHFRGAETKVPTLEIGEKGMLSQQDRTSFFGRAGCWFSEKAKGMREMGKGERRERTPKCSPGEKSD